jgi:hypothetical protein
MTVIAMTREPRDCEPPSLSGTDPVAAAPAARVADEALAVGILWRCSWYEEGLARVEKNLTIAVQCFQRGPCNPRCTVGVRYPSPGMLAASRGIHFVGPSARGDAPRSLPKL